MVSLHINQITKDIDALSYKLAETAIADEDTRDSVASDSEDVLDGAVVSNLLGEREATLRKRLGFCLHEEVIYVVDNLFDINGVYEFKLQLPESFKDGNLRVAAKMMHDYLVKGTLLDWYNSIGSAYGTTLAAEVSALESKVVDIFRVPNTVKHPSILYFPSFRSR